MFDADDPLWPVGLVVAALAVAFVAVLLGVQFGGNPEGALTLPLLLAVPLAAAGLYYYVKHR